MLAALVILGCLAAEPDEFGGAQRVTIRGYDGDAMEPFITRDGRYLLFNNSNADPSRTDLHFAERIDDVTFDYRGPIAGANTTTLDAVPTADSSGNFYFITLRSYSQNLTTIYRGRFRDGVVEAVEPVPGLTRGTPGQLNFDVEVSADGGTLYFVDGLFTGGAVPAAADLVIAIRGTDGVFRRALNGHLAAINTPDLEYAAALSEDSRELFFTRLTGSDSAIFRATRGDASQPWNRPERLTSISGFVEAPALAPGGRALYYHALRGDRFVIERVTRRRPSRQRAVRR